MKPNKNPSNQELAEILRAVAAALEVKGASQFRTIAYQRAADSIEHATSEVKDLWDDHQLGQLPGVGASIASHLDEIFRTGKSNHFEQELKGLPPGMFPLLEVPGIGPKSAYKLSLTLGLTRAHSAISKLEKSAQQGEIRNIEGFGEESEARILQGIEELKGRSNRILLHKADKTSSELIDYLTKLPQVKAAYPLGSLRRRVSTVGDIDIAVASSDPTGVIKYFTKYPAAKRVVEAGDVSATILLPDNIHVDLLVQDPQGFGSLLQHFTGSKHHNIHLREIAQKQGWSLSEKGIKKVKTKKLTTFNTEEQLYAFFKMDYIPPELREDNGEIEAAQKGKLPQLVELTDIKGDLHVHSDFDIEPSHDLGLSSMEVMITQAQQLGYQYLGFSEHNPSMSQHKDQQITDLVKRKQETIAKLNEKHEKNEKTVKILNGLEIDIRPDGKLSIPEKAFDYLDFGIASIHSSFRLNKQKMTQRILDGLNHPKIKILGHPTGRVLNEREGYELNWDKIFDYCLKHHKWVEIDAWPDRLDLPDSLVREAVNRGVRLIIDSDSHQVDHMQMLKYGVSVARRGWAEKKDVINTLTFAQLIKLI